MSEKAVSVLLSRLANRTDTDLLGFARQKLVLLGSQIYSKVHPNLESFSLSAYISQVHMRSGQNSCKLIFHHLVLYTKLEYSSVRKSRFGGGGMKVLFSHLTNEEQIKSSWKTMF